jgi:hypothetical protein
MEIISAPQAQDVITDVGTVIIKRRIPVSWQEPGRCAGCHRMLRMASGD